MPIVATIAGRKSTITNAFISSIIPCIIPTVEEIERAIQILGLDGNDLTCAYCGNKCTEWDHLRPLVTNKKPTGYISEIANLVPACSKCNQSKGSRYWMEWMLSSAAQSPKTRNVENLDERVRHLREFEAWKEPHHFDFEAVIGADLWRQHWENYERILSVMQDCDKTARVIRDAIKIH